MGDLKMRQFVSRKKIKVPRYKLYYFVFAFSIFLIFGLNVVVHLFLKNTNQTEFLNVLVGNSFGNIGEYRYSLWNENAFYYNVFGFDIESSETVMNEGHSIQEVVASNLKEVVYLYNTFQTDQYKSNYFNRYSIQSFVTQASFILQEYLKDYGIGSFVEEESIAQVLQDENIPYSNSYAASKILLQKRVEEIPSLEYYFDLQVSDYERDATTVEIDGVSFAKILFVVGTDYGSYEENQALAIRLNEILEEKEARLSRGVSLRGGTGYQGVYNQDFSSNALLIQVGGVANTIDEVNRSLKVLADVLSTYIKEDIYEEE